MKCEKIRIELLEYSKGTLGDSKAKAVEEHLATCEECRSFLMQESAFDDLLRTLPNEAPSDAVWSKIESRLYDKTPGFLEDLRSIFRKNYIKTTSALAVGVALLAIVTLQFDYSKPVNNTQTATTQDSRSAINASLRWTDDPASAGSDMMVQYIDSM